MNETLFIYNHLCMLTKIVCRHHHVHTQQEDLEICYVLTYVRSDVTMQSTTDGHMSGVCESILTAIWTEKEWESNCDIYLLKMDGFR